MQNPTIGVIGVGFVGQELVWHFKNLRKYTLGSDLHTKDILPEKCCGDIQKADIVFVAVPTPADADFKSCDISAVESAVAGIEGSKIVVIKSTVPPGTTERLQKLHPQHKFLFNPEFLTEKNARNDFCYPERQIVGFTEQSKDVACEILALLPRARFFSPAPMQSLPRWITATEAELIKLFGALFLSVKVVCANIAAEITEASGCDYRTIKEAVGADKRIGDSHLNVDCDGYRGFGGYCFPKDFTFLMDFCRKLSLGDCIGFLGKTWWYNEVLLRKQGLTVKGVSTHITDSSAESKYFKKAE